MLTLDFETEAIVGNPVASPPRPVGLAVRYPDASTDYITHWDDMKLCWESCIESDEELLFHNAPFDLSVGCHWFETDWPGWDRVHDTMFLLFLADPHSHSLRLKPSAERYLGEPPEEQNKLHNWILSNVPEATKRTAGAYIPRAPVELVRPYAIGDVERTYNLYEYLTRSLR